MKNVLMMAAAALLCAGCTMTAEKPTAPLRVGTYNIRMSPGDRGTPNAWEARRADLVALVRRLDLDVFGMQEVCPDQAKYLAEELPEYVYVGDHRGADRKSDEASPVCYRKSRFNALKSGTFWLSETPEVPASKSWGTACTRVCSWLLLEDKRTGKRFCFANTHTDHISAEAREKGMLLVIERMKEFGAGVPIVFTGDHNCREDEKPAMAVAKILRNALYESKTPPAGPWRTFDGWKWRDREVAATEALKHPIERRNMRKQAQDGAPDFGPRIDYIYVSPGVTVRDYATHADARPGAKLYPSDHFPVTATIEL
ncbi:MAG: endonuclease/exonuclease/phosphatase family protein [Kiritimatiellia bacterium]